LKPESVSTKQERIAKLAKTHPAMAFTSLNHYIDYEWVAYAYERTRKDGAVGVDGQTAEDYAQDLERNLLSLIDRLKSGRYHAPPVRRHFIPKGDGQGQRGLGIPSFEDKVAQRAIVMLLEPIYEQDFDDCSYGYRPGRSAHQALRAIRQAIMVQSGRWVLDIDVCKYFDSIDHATLRAFLAKRVTDGVVRRLIDKWLKAGVLEAGQVFYPEAGTPQGGVVSPLLSNIFLHYVLDEWFTETVQPCLKGRSSLVRFCDDFVMVFEYSDDIFRVQKVLGKRLERFGLQLHPDKSRLVDFRPHRPDTLGWSPPLPTTFNFLGFIHLWGKSRKGKWVLRQLMAKERLAQALKSIRAQCWQMMHWPHRAQHERLCCQIRGYVAYFGITDNCQRLKRLCRLAERTWRRALARRTRDHPLTWDLFARFLKRFPLPRPRIVHRYTAS
jgi:RNA-directed DNA polymerase